MAKPAPITVPVVITVSPEVIERLNRLGTEIVRLGEVLGAASQAAAEQASAGMDEIAAAAEPDDLATPALAVVPPSCGMCGRARTLDDVNDYNPLQVLKGAPLGWYSGDDGELCPECMTATIRPTERTHP